MPIVASSRTFLGGLLSAAALVAVLAAPSPASAVGLGQRPLSPGMTGEDVGQLQAWLVRLGLPVARDGQFGPSTETAVRRYEREEGITEDAIVDRDEARDMRRKARPRRPVVSFASRTLRRGVVGTDVRALQRLLIDHGVKVSADGAYGPGTARAVRTVERTAKLRVDGTVTPGEARRIRASAPAPAVTGSATPSPATLKAAPDPAPVGARVFPIRGSWKFGGDGAHFGDRGGAHEGEDVFADCGVPLAAAEAGKVVFKDSDGKAGNYLVIRGAESGEDHVYMHLRDPVTLAKGAAVTTGQVFGAVGMTGNASACHLHFEIWTAPGWYSGGAARDPMPDLKAWAAAA